MIQRFLVFLSFFAAGVLHGQKEGLIDISGHADCENAITINSEGVFGPTNSPAGYGDILEISDNKLGDKYYFEQEHNTVWYRFVTQKDGILTFDIVPENLKDDYDFMLFKVNDDEYFFCTYEVKNKIARPVRTNISRNNTSIRSMTGLEEESTNEYISSGIGKPYSKALEVKAGEKYYLLVDNVYENGEGHSIVFNQGKHVKMTGTVVDNETGKPIRANITLEDYTTGEIIAKGETNPANGRYLLKIPEDSLSENKKYNISVFAEKYFFDDQIITGKEIKLPPPKGFIAKLERLAKGKSLAIKNILFIGDRDIVIPSSLPYLRRLYKLMKNNPGLVIEIEGHTNGVGMGSEVYDHQTLSEKRAKTVYNYLVENGIDKSRMSTTGYGCSRMLYPKGTKESELQANRRVEIKIIDY